MVPVGICKALKAVNSIYFSIFVAKLRHTYICIIGPDSVHLYVRKALTSA